VHVLFRSEFPVLAPDGDVYSLVCGIVIDGDVNVGCNISVSHLRHEAFVPVDATSVLCDRYSGQRSNWDSEEGN
jgi:hypothetical protein